MRKGLLVLALGLVGGTAGCTMGARQVDYPPGRSIDADIAAVHFRGPTGEYPGMADRDEPLGVFPWQLNERHQSGG